MGRLFFARNFIFLVAGGLCRCSVRATWMAFQIDFVNGVAFRLGYDIFAHMNENRPVLEFRNLLDNWATQCFASFRISNYS